MHWLNLTIIQKHSKTVINFSPFPRSKHSPRCHAATSARFSAQPQRKLLENIKSTTEKLLLCFATTYPLSAGVVRGNTTKRHAATWLLLFAQFVKVAGPGFRWKVCFMLMGAPRTLAHTFVSVCGSGWEGENGFWCMLLFLVFAFFVLWERVALFLFWCLCFLYVCGAFSLARK